MKFFDYGLKHRNSKVLYRRIIARLILMAEQKNADFCERRLQKKTAIPDAPEKDALLLQKIWQQIEAKKK